MQRDQDVVLNEMAEHRRQGQHEGGGHAHADGRFKFLGHPHERTQAEELDQHKIVDQDCTD